MPPCGYADRLIPRDRRWRSPVRRPAGPGAWRRPRRTPPASPIAVAATPPTAALMWRCQDTSESSSMICRRPRNVPRRSASHFMKQLTTRPLRSSARGRSGSSRPALRIAVVDAVDVERVPHDRMADAVAPAGARLVAEQDDLRLRQLDAGRAGRDRRVEIEVFADLLRPRHLDLAERDRDAERGRAVRHAHRTRAPRRRRRGRASRRRARRRWSAAASWSGRSARPSDRRCRRPSSRPSRRPRPSRPSRDGRCPRAAARRSSRCRWRAATSTAARSCRCAANTVACGVITPSQPPDQTIGMLAMSASLRLPCFSSTRRNASSARMRVKSLTPPLPSVLPITAMTSSAANWPLAMQASRPDASLHGLQLDLCDLDRHRLKRSSFAAWLRRAA